MLQETIERLAALEPTPLPFLSVYVDLSPDFEGGIYAGGPEAEGQPLKSWRRSAEPAPRRFRPGVVRARDLLAAKAKMLPTRGSERDSFEADAKRIRALLEGDLEEPGFDPSMRGLAIFACSGEDFWEVVELPVPVQTRVVVDRVPYINPMAYTQDAYDRYAICLADSQYARVYVVTLGRKTLQERIKGPTINYKMTGGWSQRRIQERITNAVSWHIRDVADRLDEIVREENVRWVIIGGDEIVRTEFDKHLSPLVKDRLVEMNRMATKLPSHEVLEGSLQISLEAEQSEGRDVARRALDAALSDGLGAAGPAAVIPALRYAAVETLILDEDYHADGWRAVDDHTCFGADPAPEARCRENGSARGHDRAGSAYRRVGRVRQGQRGSAACGGRCRCAPLETAQRRLDAPRGATGVAPLFY